MSSRSLLRTSCNEISPPSRKPTRFCRVTDITPVCAAQAEPRLAFNRTVVLRYRFFLEQKNLAPSTINVRLAAVRRLAYEASDTGLLSPELAAGIHRVKGAKRLGVRIGNWLTVEQSKTLLAESPDSLRGKRDRAILALLIGCG